MSTHVIRTTFICTVDEQGLALKISYKESKKTSHKWRSNAAMHYHALRC